MKKILLLFLTVIVFTGCSKDNDEKTVEIPKDNICWISQEWYSNNITFYNNTNRFGFVYDNNQIIKAYKMILFPNVSKQIMESPGVLYSIDVSYSDNDISVTYNDGSKRVYKIYNGRIDQIEYYEKNKQIAKSNLIYNIDGYLTNIKMHNDELLLKDVKYTNGNLTSFKVSTDDYYLKYNEKNRAEYSEMLSETFIWKTGLFDLSDAILYEQGYFGKISKNGILSIEREPTFLHKYTTEYEYDNLNKVNQITIKNANNAQEINKFNYNFNCNK